ncbi:tail fiber protein [Terasakiella sp. SH-1]|uniref:phage tail protein n=1 Tax=Terasakiella sp. SH-1 TaxID=2560057 RepID=UPI0010738218|nr:tail fiber protein [Terasakiella sp. SH-1]
MKKTLSLVKVCALSTLTYSATLLSPSPALACDSEPYIGTICWTAANFCPDKYTEANGQVLQIATNQVLYSILGRTYGSNGTTTFSLPNLQGREAIGVGIGPGLQPIPNGYISNQSEYTMTMANMPAHVHSVDLSQANMTQVSVAASIAPATEVTPNGNAFAVSANATYASTPDTTMAPDIVDMVASVPNSETGPTPASGTTPISTISPQVGAIACIAVDGIYPPRN